MYIIYDKETNEYLTDIGWLWLESIGNGPPMGGPPMGLHSSVCVHASEEEARSVLADIFAMWDTRRGPVPSADDYEFRKVRSAGWVLV